MQTNLIIIIFAAIFIFAVIVIVVMRPVISLPCKHGDACGDSHEKERDTAWHSRA